MSKWETITYGEFTIALEPWGDGNYNAHLTDDANDGYDHGMIVSYMPREVALKEAKLIADGVAADPDRFEDDYSVFI